MENHLGYEKHSPADTESGAEPQEALIVPEFYNVMSFSKKITFPTVSTSSKIYESMYPAFAPALVRFSESSEYEVGDSFTSSYMGTSITITTGKDGDTINYNIMDDDNCFKVTISLNLANRTFDYHQQSYIHVPGGAILGNSDEGYQIVFVDMSDVALTEDLSVQDNYSLLYYNMPMSHEGNCQIFYVQEIEFYSTSTVNGMVYNGYTSYGGVDVRTTDDIPSVLTGGEIKTALMRAINISGSAKEEKNALFYENGVFGYTGATTGVMTFAEMVANMPWTPLFYSK